MKKSSPREVILRELGKRCLGMSGVEKESALYKMENIRQSMMGRDGDWVSTSKVVAPERIRNKIYVNENLVEGYRKIAKADPTLKKPLKAMRELIMKKIMLLDREVAHGHQDGGSQTEFYKTSGMLCLDFVHVQCDPIFEVERVDVYVDERKGGVFDVRKGGAVQVALKDSSEIEMVMVGRGEVLVGIVYLPCDFFISKGGSEVKFDFRGFNMATVRVGFEKEVKLVRKNAEIKCIYVEGHGLETHTAMSPGYCCVCGGMLLLLSASYRCFRCKFTCHKKCYAFILFKCKNGVSFEKKRVRNEYDIGHEMERETPSGFRYCGHCGERICLTEEECWRCMSCGQRFHGYCREVGFKSCGIDLELRKGMAEFRPPSPAKNLSRAVSIEDFTLVRVLGRGNFGKVVLARHGRETVAIKVLQKEKVVNSGDVFYIELEKRILREISLAAHPFLMDMKFCFQDAENMFLVTEYLSGGDLFHHVMAQAFEHEQIKLYACEILLGIEFLHTRGIIYRDLKLDNVMLSADGHVKIIDFGLCKDGMGPLGMTFTYCGTPDTIAPEVIAGNGYTKDIDWWSYGVVVYEMYERAPPFTGATSKEMCDSILNTTPVYPQIRGGAARDLISRLLEKDPRRRLGHGSRDAQAVKAHRYFSGVDWDDVLHKRTKPSFVPGDSESNFDKELSEEPVSIASPRARKSYGGLFSSF